MISIYTFALTRDLYLERLIESIKTSSVNVPFEHHIAFQGVKPNTELLRFFEHLTDSGYPVRVHMWDRNYGTGEGNNRILKVVNGNIIIKMDDDCIVRSPDFLETVMEIHRLIPTAVFSPYPVGLIRNSGGVPPSAAHIVKHSPRYDAFYTLRPVAHIGGLARIMPRSSIADFVWPDDYNQNTSGIEDSRFSDHCNASGTPMYYLENALIVEHQESTLGQHCRYGADYFGTRF